MLDKVKLALRLTTSAYDDEIMSLIDAAMIDLGIAGITYTGDPDALVIRAVITYCRMNFGSPDDYDRLCSSYKAQKEKLMMATGYTEWGED